MTYNVPTSPYHQPPPAPRRRGCSCLSGIFFLTLLLLLFASVAGAGGVAALVYSRFNAEIEEGIVALDQVRDREVFETTRIYDRDGELLWEIFGEGKRTRVPLTEIPLLLQQATIAVEDDTFYENIGLDAPSLVAALIANLRNPDSRPVGGSTITQQIVRHIVFDYEERTAVSYDRKTKEIVLAWIMNRRYSKEEILELYLNEIYYGNLAYGAEAAAQTYFGKPAAELNLAEISLLAGLPQSPVELDPFSNLDGARQRQWIVLALMVDEGFISQQEAEAAYLMPLEFAPQVVSLEAPHFSVYVRQLLEQEFGPETVANGGLRVTTTLDLDYQRLAERLAREHVAAVGPEHNLTNAALVALKPGSGEILAMLGSVDYRDETIDGQVNVVLSPQQPGSSIKPLTYAAALSPGPNGEAPQWTAGDLLWDVPVRYPQLDGTVYEPVNYSRNFHGPMRLREALANSYNVPAVLVLQDIGVPRLLQFAQQAGINSFGDDAGRYGLSLTLGGGELTPLELTSFYGVLANQGNRVPPAAILSVTRSDGTILYEYQQPAGEQLIDPRVAFLLSDILDDDEARAAAMGRDNPLALPFPAAAKTGTTNDFRDNWTLGYTPGLVVGVWTGNTDNSEMIDISGLTGAAPLWSAYMQAVYADPALHGALATNGMQPPAWYSPPPGLEQRTLCNIRSVVPGAEQCQPGMPEWFLAVEQTAPTPVPPEPVVSWQEVDPGVWQLLAAPLPAELPGELLAALRAEDDLPPPEACYFPAGSPIASLPADALPGVYLEPPRNEESRKGAYEWAAANGLAILPRIACSEELLDSGRGSELAVWRIRSPRDGDTLSGIVPIVGTADFDPANVQFYKLEIGTPDGQWLTLGDTHSTPVVNGQLETLHADAFPPGAYALRLIVVGSDSNYVGDPHTVTFTIQ
jgi:penicillin-binding protein 1C